MNYPVWQLDFAGGGLLIAMMAVFHVYISHFAIGGGLFLVMTEMKAHRENNKDILEFTRRHTRFFLLLTMVLGAMTGVGIWFTVALLNPAAVSTLIHTFIFAWATEWVFFLVEIIAIFVYYYGFGKMAADKHVTVGWLYFLFAWLSLFAINGILTFMLTPGDWLTSGNMWDGFFNPTFWPSLFFRTFLALLLAGLFGFLSAVSIKPTDFREHMTRYCALWLLAPFYFLLASAYWYMHSLPVQTRDILFNRMPEAAPFLKAFFWLTPILFTGGLIMAIRMPRTVKKPLAFLLLIIGISYLGSFEFIRESCRRPFIIYDHTYSNAIRATEAAEISQQGLAQSARWMKHRVIDDTNREAAGQEIFTLLCLSCHSLGGPLNDIIKRTGNYTPFGLSARLAALGALDSFMPPFIGTPIEKAALSAYILKELHTFKPEPVPPLSIPSSPEMPPFDMDTSDYVLLVWTDQGMRTISDSDTLWSLRPPGSNVFAVLIKRGATPQLLTEKIILSYMIDPAHSRPSDQVDFWDYSATLLGRLLPDNTGTAGKRNIGFMKNNGDTPVFSARALPVVPYTDTGHYQPYPLVTVSALGTDGSLLATAKTVLPVSTEMGCRNCHGGPWRFNSMAGLSSRTSQGVLEAHDKLSRTSLLKTAATGSPVLCQSCHDQDSDHLNLSAAMHGFHAPMFPEMGNEACGACHASSPQGATRFFRGIHNTLELGCGNCHGTMTEHAASLLKAESLAGKQEADFLLKKLSTNDTAVKDGAILPRRPWEQEPDCLNCHENFQPPENDTTFSQWTTRSDDLFGHRTDEVGIPCAACHGAPHAIYPTRNAYGEDRDNLIPLQYQGAPYPIAANQQCRVCHRQDMDEEMHHPNSLRMFRNTR